MKYSDLRRAQRLNQQECFWMLFFTQKKSISCEENDQFKNEYSFLDEGPNLSWRIFSIEYAELKGAQM